MEEIKYNLNKELTIIKIHYDPFPILPTITSRELPLIMNPGHLCLCVLRDSGLTTDTLFFGYSVLSGETLIKIRWAQKSNLYDLI